MQTLEWIKDHIEELFLNTNPLIRHADRDMSFIGLTCNHNFGRLIRAMVLECVGQQVQEKLVHKRWLCLDRRQGLDTF